VLSSPLPSLELASAGKLAAVLALWVGRSFAALKRQSRTMAWNASCRHQAAGELHGIGRSTASSVGPRMAGFAWTKADRCDAITLQPLICQSPVRMQGRTSARMPKIHTGGGRPGDLRPRPLQAEGGRATHGWPAQVLILGIQG
jgi:hypothetical protein